MASEAMVDVARSAIGGAVSALGEEISAWAQRVASQTGRIDDPSYAERLLQNLGKMAQRSMMSAYGQVVTAREGPGSLTHYRAGHGRFAGGMLRDALGSEGFFTVTGNRLMWGNRELLSATAVQWHRIAFGAGGRGHGINTQYEINFEGMLNAVIGISEGPSPGFAMPWGWWNPVGRKRGESIFTPSKRAVTQWKNMTKSKLSPSGRLASETEGQMSLALGTSAQARAGADLSARHVGMVPTEGIETHDFFSAGIRRMARELPALLTAYQQDIFGRLADAASVQLTRTVRITPKVRPSWRD